MDLNAIEASLRAVIEDRGHRDLRVKWPFDQTDHDTIHNMLSGYAFVDHLVDQNVDLFAIGNSRLFLELNARVLCGDDAAARRDAAQHLKANEEYFYDNGAGGIRDVMEWYGMHRAASVFRRAAGVYIRILSEPQVFIEGNHRTGTLVMSYMLVREGHPPFVRTTTNVESFKQWSNRFNSMKKSGPWLRWEMAWLTWRFGKFLQAHEDRQFLLRDVVDAQRLESGAKSSS